MSFNIAQWHAWAPGITEAESWQAWARAPFVPADLTLQPDVSFVPAMQRRRLTRLARMSFAAAWPLVQGKTQIPMIFGSRHGETPLTFALLQSLAQHEPLSPTQFGLSVHNAVAGQWSIQRGDIAETCAVAADEDTLEHSIIEACGLLNDGAPEVIVILAEDTPAPFYQDQIDDIPFPFAVALRLIPGTTWTLSSTPAQAGVVTPEPSFGHVLPMLRAMLLGNSSWTHHCPPRSWTWQSQC
ncbi:beta-ketoacyl synthase chain length factor [Pigmentiphaga aceris]|uniref:Beta-ketoacyl synthase chain length factor n=1 Tax=Pigmentiphaga aceris TaxID=1940612 RepID=A0A5C0B894_9BURK|nr:beta-ketoacyl synthase chain length factor [Pigmentiphaga aceris]